ncbi:Ger(x)C family spore germination protein [Bacillus sp. EAC]|uniref:Ger(x)C family spore germination protein n=1 Tax=Bacillus sp. EAC TaxID=1978338 RepID=UPI000B4550B1|nr:Ger(x)C family spore germination protein [Bacillus sp. EAC]
MRQYLLILLICMTFVLTSCSFIPSSNVNEINIIQGAGFDQEQNQLRATVTFPIFRANETTEFDIVSAKGDTLKNTREKIDKQIRHRMMSGQLRLVVFSLDLAKKGIYPIVDTFNRDPAIGNLLQMAVVEGETFDLLSLKEYKQENISLYLHDLLQQNSETGPMPKSDFSTYLYQYFEEGQDPFLPMIKNDKGTIKITGIAIFKDDKFVVKIPWNDAFAFKTLMESYKKGFHQFKFKGQHIAIDNINSKIKYKIKMKKGKPEFNIHLDMNARILEYTGPKPILLPKHIKEISKQIKKQIEKDQMELISIFQKNNVDPLGFGSKLEAHKRNFDYKKWKEQYPHVKVKIKVDLDILHTGIVE